MSKSDKDVVFFCTECGYESLKWLGKCPACGNWGTFSEMKKEKETAAQKAGGSVSLYGSEAKVYSIDDVIVDSEERVFSGIEEADRVFGGGIVRGSVSLIAGDPGIGKSTLVLMMCGNLAKEHKVLYVSGEESVKQVKMRADRLGISAKGLKLMSEVRLSAVESVIEKEDPEFLVIDSVQTICDDSLQSAVGSVTQIRETTSRLMYYAKQKNITVFIIGHITKDGSIAGPKVLEHMVDTVINFEGERQLCYRILRSVKNRFGSTNEIGVFEMKEDGLCQVLNPSAAMLDGRPENVPGTAVVCSVDGNRPVLIEVQALLSRTTLAMPRRMSTGIDYNRVSMLIAVLEKRLRYKMSECDSYINVIGGIRLTETSSDLGIAAAMMSSYKNRSVKNDTVFIGEIGLAGEVRGVNHIEQRLSESIRLGFREIFLPAGNRKAAEDFLARSGAEAKVHYVDRVSALEEIIYSDRSED
ncbi:MAG: DNA repair protein RadA [Clostridia bacterium]|nr:DNA repair protein RadA [Clostridia bacterium]